MQQVRKASVTGPPTGGSAADLGMPLCVAVGEQSRLLLSDGTSLPNLFGIGLGIGYKLPPSMAGEPNFDGQANSLWLFTTTSAP